MHYLLEQYASINVSISSKLTLTLQKPISRKLDKLGAMILKCFKVIAYLSKREKLIVLSQEQIALEKEQE